MPQVRHPKSYMARQRDMKPLWHLVDASEEPLGRMAVKVARILQGKHRPQYTPHALTGDYVVVVNAANTLVTGNKRKDKLYRHHTGYPGGIRTATMDEVMKKDPTRVIQIAVKGMLPHTTLGNTMLKRLHVYAGPDHPHQAQFAASKPAEADQPEAPA